MITRYVAIGFILGTFVSTAARAQSATSSPSNTATSNLEKAKQMFKDAWQAANEQKHEKACPMFDAALALEPSYQKAAIAAAQCYAEAGKYLTAVKRYEVAENVAANQAVQNTALLEMIRKGKALATSRISSVTIYVPGSVGSIAGVSVTLNGEIVVPSMYGTQIPLDRGSYVIVTAAPGRISRKIEFEVTGDAQDFQRTLVPLKIDPNASATTSTTKPEPTSKSLGQVPSTAEQATQESALKKLERRERPRVKTIPKSGAPIHADVDPAATNLSTENGSPSDKPPTSPKSSYTGGGVTLILFGSGALTFGSLMAIVAADRRGAGYDYSSYVGGSVVSLTIGAVGVIAGIAVTSSSSATRQKQTGLQLQTPQFLIGPGQVSFQARW